MFATKRPKSVAEQLAEMEALKQSRQANLENLRLQSEAANTKALQQAIIEQADEDKDDDTEAELRRSKISEGLLARNSKRAYGLLEQRLLKEGRRVLQNKVLFEMCYNACWVDEDVKASSVAEMYDAFNTVLDVVDGIAPECKTDMSISKFLSAVNLVIEETVQKAVGRIVYESKNNKDCDSIKFDLIDEEEADMDEKIKELGSDEIIDLVRDKVLTVVQDEKEAGKKKDEVIQAIKDGASESEEEKPEEDEMTESTMILAIEDFALTVGQWNELMETSVLEVNINDNKVNFLAEKLFHTCKLTDKEASDPKIVKERLREIMANPKSSENTKYTVCQILLLLLAIFVPTGIGAIAGPIGISVGYLIGIILMYVVALGSLGESAYYQKVKMIRSQIIDLQRKTNDPATRKKLQECEKECDNAIIRMQGMQTMESLDSLENKKLMRDINRNSGNTLFESMMIINTQAAINQSVLESSDMTDTDLMSAALLQTVFEYTVLETMSTLGLYQFTGSDVAKIRRTILEAVNSPLAGNVDMKSSEKTAGGMKKIRINTKKMKTNKDNRIMSANSAMDSETSARFKDKK